MIIENLQIWSADVWFEEGTQSKPRPVIVVDSVSYSILQLTSKTKREGYVIKDWEKAGLRKPSVIRRTGLSFSENPILRTMSGPLPKEMSKVS